MRCTNSNAERFARSVKDDADWIRFVSNFKSKRCIVQPEITRKLVNTLGNSLAGDDQIIEQWKCANRRFDRQLHAQILHGPGSHGAAEHSAERLTGNASIRIVR